MTLRIFKISLMVIAINFLFSGAAQTRTLNEMKGMELKNLNRTIAEAQRRIREAPDTRAIDFLKLLPEISVSQRGPYDTAYNSEVYVSASFNTGQIHSILKERRQRKVARRRAMKRVTSLKYIIEKLIHKKYLLKYQVWQQYQIRRSHTNPVEIARIDDVIRNVNTRILDIEIEIEKRYGEVGFLSM